MLISNVTNIDGLPIRREYLIGSIIKNAFTNRLSVNKTESFIIY